MCVEAPSQGRKWFADQRPELELQVPEDLRRVRDTVAHSEVTSPLSAQRRADFALAVNEAATNALEYGSSPRQVRLWRNGAYVVGEVAARGHIQDPLAGRRAPPPNAVRGRGLWVVDQLCDRVEVRNEDSRVVVQMRVRCE